MFVSDGALEHFKYAPDTDTVLAGAFINSGRAIISSDPDATIAGLFSFPPQQAVYYNILLALTEKVFLPAQHQLNKGETIFLALENQAVLVLFFDDPTGPLS